MIVVVLFKVIASTYLQCATKLLKKLFFLTDVCKKATLICFQVRKILWQVPVLALKS